MLDQERPFTEQDFDTYGLAFKMPGPLGVVVENVDRSDQWLEFSALGRLDLLLESVSKRLIISFFCRLSNIV